MVKEYGCDLNKLFNKTMENQLIARLPKDNTLNTPKKKKLEDGKLLIKKPKLTKKNSSTERPAV